MVASIAEDNIRKMFFQACRAENLKIFGFQWMSQRKGRDNAWFVFTEDGVSGRWFVYEGENEGVMDEYHSEHVRPEIVRPIIPSDGRCIASPNSEGLVEHDFRGCYLGGIDFQSTKFVGCIFDEGCMSPTPSNTRATFAGCEWKPITPTNSGRRRRLSRIST
jgi:hypothetical protein